MGGLHGIYLIINHAWHAVRRKLGNDLNSSTYFGSGLSRTLTFIAISVSWVLFRAESISGAGSIFRSMFGMNGLSLPESLAGRIGVMEPWLLERGFSLNGVLVVPIGKWVVGVPFIVILLLISWYAPNTQQIMSHYEPTIGTYKGLIPSCHWRFLEWRPTKIMAMLVALIAFIALMSLTRASEFLYFQF